VISAENAALQLERLPKGRLGFRELVLSIEKRPELVQVYSGLHPDIVESATHLHRLPNKLLRGASIVFSFVDRG